MDNEELLMKQLEEIYQFARLHRWVSQLNDKITDLVKRTGKTGKEQTTGLINTHYCRENGTKDELVLSLVLLNSFGMPEKELTERIFDLLYGRIDLEDQQFLISHIFHGSQPLEPEDSQDIIYRSFLSYKRALYRGMQIETLISKVNPSLTSLYLTILMCRMDINMQNRALITFLLYRIDAELPNNVKQGVLAYLGALKDIIYELFTKGKAALAEELVIEKEPVISEAAEKPEIENITTEDTKQKKASKTTGSPKKTSLSVQSQTGKSRDGVKSGKDASKGIYDISSEPGMTRADGDNIQSTSISSINHEFNTFSDGSGNRGDSDVERDAASERLQPEQMDADRYGAHPLQTGGGSQNFSESNDNNVSENIVSAGSLSDENKKNYQIMFNRSIQELLELLGEADRKEIETSESGTKPPNISLADSSAAEIVKNETLKKDTERKSDEGRSATKGKNKIAVSIAVLAVSAALIFFLLPVRRERPESAVYRSSVRSSEPVPESIPSPDSASPPASSLPSEVSIGAEDRPQQSNETASQSVTSNADSFVIIGQNGEYIWIVKEGDTVWDLFSSFGDRNAGYTIPADLDWNVFRGAIERLNPDNEDLSLIFPDNRLRLPRMEELPR